MIAIKGMKKIPKCCINCRFYEKSQTYDSLNGQPAYIPGFCNAICKYTRNTIVTKERMKECPLVEVEPEATP